MSAYKEIYAFPDTWYVRRVVVDRECDGCALTLEITITDEKSEEVVRLIHLQDEDVVSCLLEAERLVISKEIDSQREFGTVKVQCFSETYSEFLCDSVE
jgi:hypothetical protein